MTGRYDYDIYHPISHEITLSVSERDLDEALADQISLARLRVRHYHEWIHFLQSVLTTFGRYVTDSVRTESVIAALAVEGLLMHRNEVLVPIFANVDNTLDVETHNSLIDLQAMVRLRNILHGSQSWPRILRRFFNAKFPNPLGLPNPVYEIRNRAFTVSAFQIVEGHARACEMEYLFSIHKHYQLSATDVSSLLREFALIDPYDLVMHIIGDALDVFYMEAYGVAQACCDIALSPVLSAEATLEQTWEDAHPGWRFLQIVQTMRRMGINKRDIKDPEQLGARLCDELGWDEPDRALSAMLGTNDLMTAFEPSCKALRREAPFVLSHPIKHFVQLSSYFPMKIGVVVPDAVDNELARELQFMRDFYRGAECFALFLFGGKALSEGEQRRIDTGPFGAFFRDRTGIDISSFCARTRTVRRPAYEV